MITTQKNLEDILNRSVCSPEAYGDVKAHIFSNEIEFELNSNHLFTVEYDEETQEFQLIDDNWENIGIVDTNELLKLGDFKDVVICEYCENQGGFVQYNGPHEENVPCACPNVEFKLDIYDCK